MINCIAEKVTMKAEFYKTEFGSCIKNMRGGSKRRDITKA